MYDEAMIEILQAESSISKKVLSGESKIQDRVEIEDVLLEIKRIQRDTEFLKELKKHRVSSIDRRIKEGEQNVELLRDAILACMEDKGESKLDFPDVAKISTRKQAGSFEIEDQVKVEEHLKKLGVIDDVAAAVWKFDKKKLNKVLGELKENNNLPSGVKMTDGYTSISISFDDKADERSKHREREADAARWKKVEEKVSAAKSETVQYDAVEI
jgi:sulfur relay (sulfurtransferase) DsrF/TusC family protein